MPLAKPIAASLAILLAFAGPGGDAAEPSTDQRSHQLLLGLGFSAPYNMEDPFIDAAKTRAAGWRFESKTEGRIEDADAVRAGLLDPETFMPTKKAGYADHASVAVFYSGAEKFPDYYADTYVLDWKGDARGMMQRWSGSAQEDRRKNSVAYTLTRAQVKGGAMRFTAIGEGFSDIRLYRARHAALLERGEIWNPAFIDYVKRYDIVRMMDIQSTNNIQVRRFDQIATMNEPWGQRATMSWPEPPFFSAPYEILFDLGKKANVAIWLTVPPQLGAPISPADPKLRRKDKPGRLDYVAFRDTTATHAKETLASKEWEVFAKAFVDRYLASGYPLTRPLYVELGNEIWNRAPGFAVSSYYAIGIARGLDPKWKIGQGYGALSARLAVALEKEFASRRVSPNIVYVIGSHVANQWRTKDALEGFGAYAQTLGADPKLLLAKTGVAVTNYYGQFNAIGAALFGSNQPAVYAPLWIEAIRKDPKGLKQRLTTLLKDGPAATKLTGPWVVAQWKEHRKFAESAGSRLLGAYEGGSHLVPPKELENSKEFLSWWIAYHWGEDSADIGRKINRRLIEAFPDAVIANYESIGAIKPESPWIDGHYAKPTPVMEMWDEFARPPGARR
jgi:hypothetical protein